MDNKLEQIISKLRDKNIRVTGVRKDVLTVLLKYDHLTITEIVDKIRDEFEQEVNVMSVYNAISMLRENEIIFASVFNGNKIVYEADQENPMHLSCEICGIVKHVSNEEYQKILHTQVLNKILSDNKFQLHHTKFEIHGICEKCANETQFSTQIN